MARFNRTLTVGANPIRLSDFVTAATAGEILPAIYVTKLSVQMKDASAGIGYVMLGIPNGITPNPATDGQLTAELSPPSAGIVGPGSQLSDPQSYGPLQGTEELQKAWVHGNTPGDKLIVSWDTVN